MTEKYNEDINSIADSVGAWGFKLYKEESFPREEYRDFLELTLVYLGVPVFPFAFRKPGRSVIVIHPVFSCWYIFSLMSTGAHHHVRFMAYGINYLKMQLISEKFQMSVKERRNVKRMADFVALFYTEAFLRSRLATLAPASDLKFLSHMNAFKQVDEIAATAAIKSASNHLWYLCEELVVFSIFDRELPPDLRQQLLNRPLEFPRPNTFLSQKPKFPTFDPSSIEYPRQLLDFVGPRSWLVFELLG
jgi:hypothetical protein